MTPRARLDAIAAPGPVPVPWLDIASPAIAEIAALSGFRAAVIDREHGQIGIETAAQMTRALATQGVAAITRVPELSEGAIKHALDAGSAGAMVPMIETAAEAARAVRYHAYPPLGRRGAAMPVIPGTGYGLAAHYRSDWNDRALLCLQIESAQGVENAPEIAAVAGAGMLFFGPFDYASEQGLDPATDSGALWDVWHKIHAAASAHGLVSGVFPWPEASPAALAAAGADFIATASDIRLLVDGFAAAAKKIEDPMT